MASCRLDYDFLREDALGRAEASVAVGLASLADAKYLRRKFGTLGLWRKRVPKDTQKTTGFLTMGV